MQFHFSDRYYTALVLGAVVAMILAACWVERWIRGR